jgi:hypothetical protein
MASDSKCRIALRERLVSLNEYHGRDELRVHAVMSSELLPGLGLEGGEFEHGFAVTVNDQLDVFRTESAHVVKQDDVGRWHHTTRIPACSQLRHVTMPGRLYDCGVMSDSLTVVRVAAAQRYPVRRRERVAVLWGAARPYPAWLVCQGS